MTEKSLIFGILLFLKLQVCCCFYTQHTLPDIENAHFIEECVSVHNRFRSSVDPPASNMKRMSWDHDLAKTALGWAHPNFTAVGENIWTGSIWYFNVTSALTNWYDEVQYYNYATQRCKDVCGHYTQMVWAKTYKVGCAVHFCPIVQGFGGSNAFFNCNLSEILLEGKSLTPVGVFMSIYSFDMKNYNSRLKPTVKQMLSSISRMQI
uniref:SCP domain-containing protein n=1 Tax=Naja naja TaxID=35670 RepID=A0A8C6VPR5_NAJNA